MQAESETSRPRQERHTKRYAASILLVCAASLLTLAVTPLFDGKSPLAILLLAILLAAAYGGTRQGLLATALGTGMAALFFHAHAIVLILANSSLTLMIVLGAAISIVMGKLRRTSDVLSRTRDELKLANQTLVDRADTLSRSNADLERFAYAVAHDLNAPLRTIRTRAEICRERSRNVLDSDSAECLDMVVRSAQKMSSLIENLLTLARISHEPESLAAEVDTNKIAGLALQYLRDEINSSRAIVRLDPLPSVAANEHQLLRLFQNLLSNAVKYRNGQEPIIEISAIQDGADWRFSISDNGIGMDAKYHSKIFEPFQRLHGAAEYEGCGMGLAICKQIVEQHGGRIWVESSPGIGSRFYFTLPSAGVATVEKKVAEHVAG